MRSNAAKCLIIFAIGTIASACGSTPHAQLLPPARPLFAHYDVEAWETLPGRLYDLAGRMEPGPDHALIIAATNWMITAQENIAADDLLCKKYMDLTERRIEIHNGRSE